MDNPFAIIKSRYITEKSATLEGLQNAESNRSVRRCQSPKVVFVVDVKANKHQIAEAVEAIYKEQGISVVSVNTIQVKSKAKRARRGRPGKTRAFKKAIVTLAEGNQIDTISS